MTYAVYSQVMEIDLKLLLAYVIVSVSSFGDEPLFYVHSPTPNVQYRADSRRHLFVLLLLFSFFLVSV